MDVNTKRIFALTFRKVKEHFVTEINIFNEERNLRNKKFQANQTGVSKNETLLKFCTFLNRNQLRFVA